MAYHLCNDCGDSVADISTAASYKCDIRLIADCPKICWRMLQHFKREPNLAVVGSPTDPLFMCFALLGCRHNHCELRVMICELDRKKSTYIMRLAVWHRIGHMRVVGLERHGVRRNSIHVTNKAQSLHASMSNARKATAERINSESFVVKTTTFLLQLGIRSKQQHLEGSNSCQTDAP